MALNKLSCQSYRVITSGPFRTQEAECSTLLENLADDAIA